MRVLYGVVGEGMGHATRSKVVCEHLIAAGHELKIVVSGRAHAFLAKSFPDVVEIRGLTIQYVDNAMDRDGTLARNVLAAPGMLLENVSAYYDGVVGFNPDLVITDFDSFAYLFAKRHGLPIISIDNQQIISRCKHSAAIKRHAKVDYQLTKAFVRAKIPRCEHYIVTTFFFPPVRKKYAPSTTLVPPVLRRPIVDAKPRARLGEHVLVYQTSTSDTTLIPTLNALADHRFIVYGLGRSEQIGNCLLKEFSEDGFVDDLATAGAVCANGGLSLLGEAVFLGKPIFSVPVRHQYEQLMNARYVAQLEYGVCADETSPEALRKFLRNVGAYAARVAQHAQDGNKLLLQTVDALLTKLVKHPRKRAKRGAPLSP